jgi:branched-chain amino acid transport system ATP-binding protein
MGLLSVSGLEKRFGGVIAVDDVDFEIDHGSIIGLIGPNGAGKTTIFSLISGFLAEDKGSIQLNGEELTALSPSQRMQRGLAHSFQHPRNFGDLTVLENLLVAGRNVRSEDVLSALKTDAKPASDDALWNRSLEVLEVIELDDLENEYAKNLSGGQSKLLSIGKTLMKDPNLILLDEPTAGVQPNLIDRFERMLVELNETNETTLFIIEHDLSFISSIAEEIIVLSDGAIIAQGTYDEVTDNSEVINAYIG